MFQPCDRNLESNDVTVFFHSAGMGGIGLRKGTDLVVKAFDLINDESRLIIHSQVPKEKFGDVVNIIDRNKNIEFIEKTVPAPGLYYMGDVYVYPSKLDGLGLTVIEAMSSGLPVITTDCAPMNEFVIDGYNGYLVDVESYLGRGDGYYWAESHCSVESLKEKMQLCINSNASLRLMKNNARKYALQYLDWSVNSKLLESFVSEIGMAQLSSSYFKSLSKLALYYSIKNRKNSCSIRKKIFRKIYRSIHGLNY